MRMPHVRARPTALKRLSIFASSAFSISERGDPTQRRKRDLGRRFVVSVKYGGAGTPGGSSTGGVGGGETPIKSPTVPGSPSPSSPSSASSASSVSSSPVDPSGNLTCTICCLF